GNGNRGNGNRGNGNVGNGNRGNGNRGNGNVGNGNRGNGNAGNGNRNNGNKNSNRNNGNTKNKNGNNNGNRSNNNVTVNNNRTAISNPVYGGGGAWGWNGGSAWYPASGYWGGGFWGAMAVGVTSAAVYGSIVGANNQTYNSYHVEANSPGATFLSNYGLVQVECGGSGQVVVYGPQNSVICANPNGTVGAGEYNLNTETLSLTPY
ncbi:MAG: hypothetical protein WCC84_02410, partial [Candidatus Cybelea sp.]